MAPSKTVADAPRRARDPQDTSPTTFARVLQDELGRVNASRQKRGVTAKAHADNLIGLAFSGGGIRSATFNLGILQALAEKGLLHKFDYLSTVSGGGYLPADRGLRRGCRLALCFRRCAELDREGAYRFWSAHRNRL